MMNLMITGGRILDPSGELLCSGPVFDAGLTVSGGRIGGAAQDVKRIDADGLIVSPGFLDLQINVGFGIDLLSDPDGMWQLGDQLPQHGVTGFLPTIITSPPERTEAAIRALHNQPTDHRGARPLGLHFEGPMLSPSRPGAHPPQYLSAADLAVITTWSRDNGVALVTMAPELPNASAVISELVSRGVAVSAGHSAATADQARVGIDAGVTLVTHLFNAMSPLGHRVRNLVRSATVRRVRRCWPPPPHPLG